MKTKIMHSFISIKCLILINDDNKHQTPVGIAGVRLLIAQNTIHAVCFKLSKYKVLFANCY